MSINALYLTPFPSGDTTTSKLRVSVKTSGAEDIFSSLMIIQLVTSSLPPITTTSNYMTIFHAGTNAGSGLGIFLKYSGSNYYIGVRYIIKGGSTWNEVPGSFVNLSDYSSNLNTDPFMIMLSYNITSTSSPFLTFSIVNFSPSYLKTSPDFTLNYTFSSTNINNGSQWGFGSSPQTNTGEYGLITSNGYNSYSSAGIYLTYLEGWISYINTTSSSPTTYAMFNTSSSSYSIYSIMRSNSFIPAATTNLVFQLNIPDTNLNNLNNNVTSPTTFVTLVANSTGYGPMPNFAVNGSTTGTTYMIAVQNAIACILQGMKVLTENGYKLIEDLKLEDKLIANDGRSITIINIEKFYVKPNKHTIPLIISEGKYGCIEDLYLSKAHKIMVDGKFILPESMGIQQMEYKSLEPICYFHIETPNFLEDNMIVNGVVVETYTPDHILSQLKFNC